MANIDLFSEMYMFRPLDKSKKRWALVRTNKLISNTTAR